MQIFLSKKKKKNITQWHSHTNTQRFTLETPKGITSFLRVSLALFVSFIALYKMFKIQYKVSTNLRNPNSNTGIRKPWTKKPNTMDCKTAYHNTAKNGPKFFLRGLCPQTPRSALRITVLELMLWKLTGGALSGYPLRRRHIAHGANRDRGQTPCKEYNINPTFSHLLFSLHTGRKFF